MIFNDKIDDILGILTNGGLIVFPTDTVWGIGCDATNDTTVEKIRRMKDWPPQDGFVVLVDSLDMLHDYVSEIHPRLETLMHYHTRPLTVVYDRPEGLSSQAQATDGSAAIRIVQDPFCSKLIHAFGKPLVATIASVRRDDFPTHFGAISSEVLQQVDYVVRYRQDDKQHHQPSAIVRLSPDTEELEFLRD